MQGAAEKMAHLGSQTLKLILTYRLPELGPRFPHKPALHAPSVTPFALDIARGRDFFSRYRIFFITVAVQQWSWLPTN